MRDSIPEVGSGKVLSYAASSPPLAAPPLGGALTGAAFLSSFFAG